MAKSRMNIMAKARTNYVHTPSIPKKCTKRGKKASILPVVFLEASQSFAFHLKLADTWDEGNQTLVIKDINIPEYSPTEMKLEELEFKLKLQLRKMDTKGEAVMEKTDVDYEVLTCPKTLKKMEIDPLHPDTGRLRALADAAYSHLLMLADVALSHKDVNDCES